MENRRAIPMIIKGATLIRKNFSGREGKYNPEGVRSFSVILNNEDMYQYLVAIGRINREPNDECPYTNAELAQRLSDDGWNIKILSPRTEDEEPKYCLPVAVSFDHIPPTVYLIVNRRKTPLDAESVGSLDYADIMEADLSINPRCWEANGNTGVKAYLKQLYVTIGDDELSEKYADFE